MTGGAEAERCTAIALDRWRRDVARRLPGPSSVRHRITAWRTGYYRE